ncbi:NusG domain II-containing protein [Enterococcus faecalis]
MKRILHQFKLWDYIVILTCIVLSFAPLAVFTVHQINQPKVNTKIAIVKIDGKEVDKFEINTINHMEKTYYPSEGKYNIIEIKKGKIRDKEDNSPDQIAVKTGWISEVGQTSICIPHHLVIEIIGKEDKKGEEYHIY